MTDAVLGIDVSKNTFDTNLGAGIKARSQSFANSPDGWHHLIAWLGEHKIGQVHACLEATGRHGLGIALALHEAGHMWTPPFGKGFYERLCKTVGCSHMSGLCARLLWPLALMVSAD